MGISNNQNQSNDVRELCYTILNIAEELFGQRQSSDFEVYESEKEYPYFEYYPTPSVDVCKIFFTEKSKLNKCFLGFELAHEVIHLLTPTSGSEVTNFEEGVATFFSFYYLEHVGEKEYAEERMKFLKCNLNYLTAFDSLKHVNDLSIKIRQIRENEPTLKLSRFKNEHFLELTDNISLIGYWSTKFEY